MDYYNYTQYFNRLITNTETIYENQETIINNQKEIIKINSILAFSLILYIIITFVRRVFNKR